MGRLDQWAIMGYVCVPLSREHVAFDSLITSAGDSQAARVGNGGKGGHFPQAQRLSICSETSGSSYGQAEYLEPANG